MKDRLLFLLKVLISLGLIFYLFSRVQLGKVAGAIGSANYWYLLSALALYFLAITLNCFKWQILLRAQRIEVPFLSLLSYTFEGLFFGNFVPTNVVGVDLVRGYDLARHTDRAAEAAISVLVDRLVGLIAFISIAAAMAVIAAYLTGLASLRLLMVVTVIALILFVVGFVLLLSHRLRALLERLFDLSWLLGFAPLYRRLSQALGFYRHSYDALGKAFLISASVLIITSFLNYLIALALGGGISPLYIFLFNPLIAFVLLIPISVGGIGLNQSAYIFFFNLVGVPEVKSLSLSLIIQVIIILASLPGGIIWWRKRRIASPAMETEEVWEGDVSD